MMVPDRGALEILTTRVLGRIRGVRGALLRASGKTRSDFVRMDLNVALHRLQVVEDEVRALAALARGKPVSADRRRNG